MPDFHFIDAVATEREALIERGIEIERRIVDLRTGQIAGLYPEGHDVQPDVDRAVAQRDAIVQQLEALPTPEGES